MKYDHWLLFDTNMCNWIVKMCYLYKYKKETKQKEYRLEFDYEERYRFEMNYYERSKNFTIEIFKNNRLITKIVFKDPTEFCQKLVACPNKCIDLFIVQNLYYSGFIIR